MPKPGKKWLGFTFDVKEEKKNGSQSSSSSCFFKKPRNNYLPVTEKRTFNFHQHLAPSSVSDLAVHQKKIAEVESWLQSNVCDKTKNSQTARFLLLTGPTGSGKTVTIQVLCKSLSIDITEWVNPVDQDFEICRGLNQVNRFLEFLTESKWNSLLSSSNKKIVLIEEFPNVFLRNPEEFHQVLEECFYKASNPIVFICTDSFNSKFNLVEKLFPEQLRIKYKIGQISFNSCATSLMKNALKRAQSLVQNNSDLFKILPQSTINAITTTAMGDIKCAINQFYFASLLGTSDLPVVTEKQPAQKTGSKRKRIESTSSIQIMSRDENLGLFHALGRILNPKYLENGRISCDFEKLIDEFSMQPGIFTAFLFENYIKYFGDLEDASEALEALSLSQTFLEKWVDRHEVLTFALWISVIGLMIHNRHKVSRWTQIKAPVKVIKKIVNDPETRNLSVMDTYYYNIIKNKENLQFTAFD